MSLATRSISLTIIITNNIITSCMHVKVMIRVIFWSRLGGGGGGGGGEIARGGDIFLGNRLWEENLSLGYSLPRRRFPGGGSVL